MPACGAGRQRRWMVWKKQDLTSERLRTFREQVELMRKVNLSKVTLAPEKKLEVGITYRVPNSVMNSLVAGVGFEPTTFGL